MHRWHRAGHFVGQPAPTKVSAGAITQAEFAGYFFANPLAYCFATNVERGV